jgi:hypothetical protein
MPPICPPRARFLKKTTGAHTAKRAAIGYRTIKAGQSNWFVGYKKHTLRLWLVEHQAAVLLVPLVSWLSPANHGDGGFLVPSLKYVWRHWSWCPRFVVGDFGYIGAPGKSYCRQQWGTAVLTHRRGDQLLVPPFGVREPATLCTCCWQASSCLREFVYPAKAQETLLGRLPLNTRAAQTLLKGVRPWIEAAQSFEKNQLGLNQIFFNSLRLAWCIGLLADSACLLRAHVLLQQLRHCKALLAELAPRQMTMDLS